MTIDTSREKSLVHACFALESGSIDVAKKIIETDFPFSHYLKDEGKAPNYTYQFKIFQRDGFIDRFTGQKVFLPPVLTILSMKLPDVFPNHPNWKYDETHQGHEMFYACVKKIIPNHPADESNLATTSYKNFRYKSNATLEDLGWKLYSLEEIADIRWDGMTDFFVKYVEKHSDLLDTPLIANWYKAIQNF